MGLINISYSIICDPQSLLFKSFGYRSSGLSLGVLATYKYEGGFE